MTLGLIYVNKCISGFYIEINVIKTLYKHISLQVIKVSYLCFLLALSLGDYKNNFILYVNQLKLILLAKEDVISVKCKKYIFNIILNAFLF